MESPNYYDAFILKQVSREPDMEDLNESSVQEFFNSLGHRMVTRLHTFKPDYLEGPGWVVRMYDWRISFFNTIFISTAIYA